LDVSRDRGEPGWLDALLMAGLGALFSSQHDRRDAAAEATERLSANWTRIGAIAAWASALVAAVAAGFLVLQLQAAEQANAVADRNLVVSQRPYVVFAGFQYDAFNDVTRNDQPVISVTPQWINQGNTPTRNLAIYISGVSDHPYSPRDLVVPGNAQLTTLSLGPKAQFAGNDFKISGDDADQMQQDRLKLYVWGVANYQDAFSDAAPRRTQFCEMFYGETKDSKGNLTTLYTTACPGPGLSCADEECGLPGPKR
jgi:hypothetical protein